MYRFVLFSDWSTQRPACIRVDQLDREHLMPGSKVATNRRRRTSEMSAESAEDLEAGNDSDDEPSPRKVDIAKCTYPLIIHFGIRPAQLSYAGDSK